ncbi:MAG TPA: hypothetical protein VIH09_01655 [Flavobacterium sp.]|uniref:hypothetical protein n=1 Tax=Flavobacterium sp. TaxID=239 RepID=UPI002F40055A
MKKVLLSLALVLALMTSCKEKTQDKVGEATEAVGDEMSDAADTTKARVDRAIESGAAKVEEAAKDVKDDHK